MTTIFAVALIFATILGTLAIGIAASYYLVNGILYAMSPRQPRAVLVPQTQASGD